MTHWLSQTETGRAHTRTHSNTVMPARVLEPTPADASDGAAVLSVVRAWESKYAKNAADGAKKRGKDFSPKAAKSKMYQGNTSGVSACAHCRCLTHPCMHACVDMHPCMERC